MSESKRKTVRRGDGPSAEDLAELASALEELLPALELPALPGDALSQLAHETGSRGYYLGISAAVGTGAYTVSIPVGKKPIKVVIGPDVDAADMLRRLILVARKLPPR